MATAKLGTELNKFSKLQQELSKYTEQIKAIEKKQEPLKKKLAEQEDRIFKLFKNDDIDGATTASARFRVDRNTVYNIKKPEDFYKYVKKSGNFQLLQRRLNNKEIQEIVDDTKKMVPGVEPFIVIKLKTLKK